jgi:2-methylcitrate dehydratase PrpD
VAAARHGLGAPALTVAAELGGPAEASLLGRDVKVAAPAAALAWGTLVHALDFDDTHAAGLVHATAAVLPAVLAVGEQSGATGEECLLAAVAGYETVCRIAAAAPHAFHGRGLHATSVAGVFAATIVAARLARLEVATTVNALGIAGSQAGGLLEFLATGSSTKQLHPGLAAQSGLLAVRLAAAGADGPASVLEGDRGLYAALADVRVEADAVTEGLGERWESTRITIKPYPSCQLMHAALDAVRTLLPLPEGQSATTIREVAVDVHPDSADIVCLPRPDKLAPRTVYDAKFSLPWSVAALLVDGEVTLATYTDAALTRPEVLDLAERVQVQVMHFPGVAADAPGAAYVTLADGTVLEGSVPHSAGGPDHRLDEAAFTAKLAGNLGGTDTAHDLINALHDLPKAPDLSRIIDLAQEALA